MRQRSILHDLNTVCSEVAVVKGIRNALLTSWLGRLNVFVVFVFLSQLEDCSLCWGARNIIDCSRTADSLLDAMRVLAFFGLVSLLPVAKAQNAVGVLVATKQHSAGPELAAKPGQSPRHIHVEDGRGSNLPDGKDGLGLNYAKHGGSHRGYVDAMFHEGEQQGIHDHEAAIASQEDYHEMWKGFHADNIAKPADTTYAGKNRPKHKVRFQSKVRIGLVGVRRW